MNLYGKYIISVSLTSDYKIIDIICFNKLIKMGKNH